MKLDTWTIWYTWPLSPTQTDKISISRVQGLTGTDLLSGAKKLRECWRRSSFPCYRQPHLVSICRWQNLISRKMKPGLLFIFRVQKMALCRVILNLFISHNFYVALDWRGYIFHLRCKLPGIQIAITLFILSQRLCSYCFQSRKRCYTFPSTLLFNIKQALKRSRFELIMW